MERANEGSLTGAEAGGPAVDLYEWSGARCGGAERRACVVLDADGVRGFTSGADASACGGRRRRDVAAAGERWLERTRPVLPDGRRAQRCTQRLGLCQRCSPL